MEIVKFKREQEQHQAHIRRIRTMQPTLNTSPPESLGLKHLALRPKKMQLVEDRRQVVAKENAKLMGLMTGVRRFTMMLITLSNQISLYLSDNE